MRHRPVQGRAVTGVLLERGAKGRYGLLDVRRVALPLAQQQESTTEVVLRHGPVQGDAVAGVLLERSAKCRYGLLNALYAALPLAED